MILTSISLAAEDWPLKTGIRVQAPGSGLRERMRAWRRKHCSFERQGWIWDQLMKADCLFLVLVVGV